MQYSRGGTGRSEARDGKRGREREYIFSPSWTGAKLINENEIWVSLFLSLFLPPSAHPSLVHSSFTRSYLALSPLLVSSPGRIVADSKTSPTRYMHATCTRVREFDCCPSLVHVPLFYTLSSPAETQISAAMKAVYKAKSARLVPFKGGFGTRGWTGVEDI